jgi:RNA polymerase sigma factor (sigma-70 family)
MGEDALSSAVLTASQRRLVRENVGLVAVHLKRNVANLSLPRRDREWDDLFQEGCLGLIRAAVGYRPDCGIPFAAYALPRIHNAVTRALQTKFCNVYVPPRKKGKRAMLKGKRKCGDPFGRPGERSLADDAGYEPADSRRHDPTCDAGSETIAERLRGKYERAVRRAKAILSERRSRRGDRAELLDRLERERFLVPQEEAKHPLRRVAQDTGSSYGRVALYEKQMSRTIRGLLEDDPEFVALRRRARSNPFGTSDVIDDEVESDLARSAAYEFVKRYRAADGSARAAMLMKLLEVQEPKLSGLIESCFASLDADARERMLSL